MPTLSKIRILPSIEFLLVASVTLAPAALWAQNASNSSSPATTQNQSQPQPAQQKQSSAKPTVSQVDSTEPSFAHVPPGWHPGQVASDTGDDSSSDLITDAATTATPVDVPQPKLTKDGTMPGVRPGSIDDVNAVGTRNIGGRGLGNWYSTDSEIKMGKEYATEIEKSTRFITDPVVTEYVNRIGQNIVRNSDCKVPFTIKVIDSDEINAMALPGGFFYVNSGLILAADEEAELAGVMAHETAHVCAHHAAREMTRANYAQIGSIPLIMMTGYSWTGYGIYEATQLAIPITFLEFSREFEAQADFLGLQYMYRAGYDPEAFVSFFEKVQNLEKEKPGVLSKAFSTHPQTPDRIEHSQEEIARILPPRNEYLVTTSEFADVKARLARIENKRKLNDLKNGKKPTLRRASTSNSDDSNGPPTLHRRDDSSSN